MARLTISWQSVSSVSPKAATTKAEDLEEQTEEGKPQAQSSARAKQPTIVFVTADDPTHKIMRKLDDVVFKDERICTVRSSSGA